MAPECLLGYQVNIQQGAHLVTSPEGAQMGQSVYWPGPSLQREFS